MKGILTKAETDALLQEALTFAGGNMELVARTALQELVKLKAEKLAQPDPDTETIKKRRGRPPKPGLSKQYAKYRPAKPLGAPNKMGLPVSTKDCGDMALSIQEYGVTVSDSPITETKPQSDVEAAERTLQGLDPGWFLDSVKHKKNIANVAKRMSEVRSRKP